MFTQEIVDFFNENKIFTSKDAGKNGFKLNKDKLIVWDYSVIEPYATFRGGKKFIRWVHLATQEVIYH